MELTVQDPRDLQDLQDPRDPQDPTYPSLIQSPSVALSVSTTSPRASLSPEESTSGTGSYWRHG